MAVKLLLMTLKSDKRENEVFEGILSVNSDFFFFLILKAISNREKLRKGEYRVGEKQTPAILLHHW